MSATEPIRAPQAPPAAPQQGGLKRAMTGTLHALGSLIGIRYQSTFERSGAAPQAGPSPSLWQRASGALGAAKDHVVAFLSNAATHTRDAINAAVATLEEKGVLGAAAQWLGQAYDALKASIKWAGEKAYEALRYVTTPFRNFFTTVFRAFSQHQREIDRALDEQHREQQRLDEQRTQTKHDEAKHLEDTVQKAKALAAQQDFQAQQGLIDKVTATNQHSQVDNGALERQRDRQKAQKALS